MTRGTWRIDAAAILLVAVFAVWVVLAPFPPQWDTALDYGLFLLIGTSVSWFQWRVSARVATAGERVAWRLLAAASIVRILSGTGWSIWLLENGAAPRPWWMLMVTASSLVLTLAGLLAFSTERRSNVDRVRLTIDVAIVSIGSGLLLWSVALGPFFEATGRQAPRLEDYIYTVADALAAVLAAVVYLRSGTRYMKAVAALLLAACLVQVVPDVLFWANKTSYSYRPRDAIAVLWFSVWTLKGIAARYAEHTLVRGDAADLGYDSAYRSGLLPHAFLLSATVVLLLRVESAAPADALVSVIAAAGLATLVVARQAVELRERARLHRVVHEEEEWYGALLRDAFDVVLLLDRGGRVHYLSPASEKLLGGAADLRAPWALLERTHTEDRAALRASLQSAAPSDLRVRFMAAADDAWREFDLHVEDKSDDQLVGAVVVNGHDITGASDLTGRLRQAQELEALGVFAGGLSHDLNNILTVIDAHTEMLLDDAPPGHVIRDDLTAVRTAAARARRLTRGLLALSRRKANSEVNLDLRDLVGHRLVAAALDARIAVHADGPLLPVRVNPNAITLAVDALLLNVFEAVPEEVSLELRLRTAELDGTASAELDLAPGSYVVLSMRGMVSSIDNLALLMSHAAVREVGGALTMTAERVPVIDMYVPTARVI